MENKLDPILGIHDGHNAAAALLIDGEIIDVVQEERLTRVKNAGDFPKLVANEILNANKITDPIPAFNGLYMSYGNADKNAILNDYENSKSLKMAIKTKIKKNQLIYNIYKKYRNKDRINIIGKEFGPKSVKRMNFVEHHAAHAAAAYYGWGNKDKALVLTCDGCGDGLCATVNVGEKGKIKRIISITEDNSIGRLYAYITYLMGMTPLEHEYKIMGLAPYAPYSNDVERIYKKFNDLFEFEKSNGGLTWKRKSGVPSMYAPGNFIDRLIYRERFDHIAAGLQLFVENFLKEWVNNCVKETGIKKVALGGGVFMNVKANKTIYELPNVEELFVFPSCGDESNAIGAAYHSFIENGGTEIKPFNANYFGTAINDIDVENTLSKFRFKNKIKIEHKKNIEKDVAQLLAKGEIVGRVKGKMEFGARALGNRSILANPSSPKVVRIINEMIKCRDFWMPFAPSVLAEKSERYMIKPKAIISPYMMMTFDTRPEKREKFIAAIHPFDYTSRPQEVIENFNPDYYKLIKYYEDLTDDAIILNTSYNLHGYPIVYSAYDALEVFNNSGLKYLSLGNFLLKKYE